MTTSSDSSLLEALGKLLVSGVLGALQFVSRGWAISTIWNWFTPPFNAPHLGLVAAVGLSMVVSILTTDFSKAIKEHQEDEREWSTKMVESFCIAAICYPILVGVAWVVHSLL